MKLFSLCLFLPALFGQPPSVSISLNPTTITVGQSATLTWSATGATSCQGGGDPFIAVWNAAVPTNGKQTVTQQPPGTYVPYAYGPAGTYVYALTCTANGASASASATLTVTNPGTPPTITEAITSLPADITPLLSIAGIWQPVANQYLRLGSNGDGNGSIVPFAQNIILANAREGLVAAGWSCCDARTSDNTPPAGIPVTPVNIAILEQQQDGTLRLTTSKYASDPQTNGAGRVLVGDFNQDGIEDFFCRPTTKAHFCRLPALRTYREKTEPIPKSLLAISWKGTGGPWQALREPPRSSW